MGFTGKRPVTIRRATLWLPKTPPDLKIQGFRSFVIMVAATMSSAEPMGTGREERPSGRPVQGHGNQQICGGGAAQAIVAGDFLVAVTVRFQARAGTDGEPLL